jgi:hypothetical protein
MLSVLDDPITSSFTPETVVRARDVTLQTYEDSVRTMRDIERQQVSVQNDGETHTVTYDAIRAWMNRQGASTRGMSLEQAGRVMVDTQIIRERNRRVDMNRNRDDE